MKYTYQKIGEKKQTIDPWTYIIKYRGREGERERTYRSNLMVAEGVRVLEAERGFTDTEGVAGRTPWQRSQLPSLKNWTGPKLPVGLQLEH